ncbi:hypothetical protein [Spirosoma panaciterrae]|uniref:hypothetical protein n=1 Tax=Spirosoma panaciterrae TaxID=496058 RepID=UPI000381A5C5|nr:hypothetical protein [Spirosoma panaciterrae]
MTATEKEEVKGIIREMMHENKDFFKDIIREIIEEDTSRSDRKAKIDAIIKRDFKRYENVFKALA